jgi:hypothetical protein
MTEEVGIGVRIRSFKPEFWRSPDIAALDIPDRLLFLSLWSYVDDNGVGIDRLADIVADCWAPDLEKDPAGTFERVACGLQQLDASGRIIRYDGHKVRNNGETIPLLYVVNWDRHQQIARPNKPRFSRPTWVNDEPACNLQQDAAISVLGTGEQGNRGTGEQSVGRKRPSVPIPPDWTPTDLHRERATAKGIDVDVLAEEMRNWAESKDERKVDWNKAFTNWIIRATKTPSNALQQRATSGRVWQE